MHIIKTCAMTLNIFSIDSLWSAMIVLDRQIIYLMGFIHQLILSHKSRKSISHFSFQSFNQSNPIKYYLFSRVHSITQAESPRCPNCPLVLVRDVYPSFFIPSHNGNCTHIYRSTWSYLVRTSSKNVSSHPSFFSALRHFSP